jgi:ABC-type antimicrobial peptide transport system permease subunit
MRGIDSALRAAHARFVPYTYVVQRVIAAPVGCLRRRPAPFPDQTHASHKAVYASVKGWSVVVPALAWGGGFGIAVLIGAIAGFLPAVRAARLSPTEALWAI